MDDGLTVADIARLLKLDRETGQLFWRSRSAEMFEDGARSASHRANNWNSRFAGKEAFTVVKNGGYREGTVFYKKMYAHRVIWALTHGHWPQGEIDHIDGDPSNNRPDNLRDVSHHENQKNQAAPKSNSSGYVGVWWWPEREKWVARIFHNMRNQTLGYFDSLEDAIAARKAAEKELGFHENHGRM